MKLILSLILDLIIVIVLIVSIHQFYIAFSNSDSLSEVELVPDDFTDSYPDVNKYEKPSYSKVDFGLSSDYKNQDSSNDGFTDYESLKRSDLSVNKKNILIQVSYSENVNVSRIPFQELAEVYEEQAGIKLVIDIDDSPQIQQDSLTPSKYRSVKNKYHTMDDEGYVHIAIVENVYSKNGDSMYYGFNTNGNDGMVVQYNQPTTMHVLRTISHELGHQYGLNPRVFQGVDSHNYSYEEYPSVMNYNTPVECLFTHQSTTGGYGVQISNNTIIQCHQEPVIDYSTGKGFDDWSVILSNLDE